MVVESAISIVYKVISTHDNRQPALAFIEMWGQKWHGCSPPYTTGDIIVAYEGKEVIGTVSLDFGNDNHPFSLEALYDFSLVWKYFPSLFRNHIVQGGRWFASRSKTSVSRMLLHAIAEYSLPRGVTHMVAEVKQTSIKRLEELGIQFVILAGVEPVLDSIPPEGLKYYIDLPPPRLMIIDLSLLCIEGTTILS